MPAFIGAAKTFRLVSVKKKRDTFKTVTPVRLPAKTGSGKRDFEFIGGGLVRKPVNAHAAKETAFARAFPEKKAEALSALSPSFLIIN